MLDRVVSRNAHNILGWERSSEKPEDEYLQPSMSTRDGWWLWYLTALIFTALFVVTAHSLFFKLL